MGTKATSTISVLIVDDEALAADEIAYLLREHADAEVIAAASNGVEAIQLIETLEPDLVFLDVQMPGLDGLGVIRTLKERNVPLPHFVMTTAFDHYAVEAFRLEALDYLLKPVSQQRLSETMERARRVISELATNAEAATIKPASQAAQKILVRQGPRNLIVDVQDVVFATIDQGEVSVVTTSFEGPASYKTIEELQSNLDPEQFWRVHRSFLVNINQIKEVIPWFKSSFQLKMNDKSATEIPVSRMQTRRLRELFRL
jgi:two-component system, LytTR family, response regulator LytT